MTGPGTSQPFGATLLADANVLIDYRDSGDLTILSLVAEHVGPLVVVSTVFDEVRELTAEDCARFRIEIVEPTTEQQIRAGSIEARASFNDRVCLVVYQDERWTCVTNDRALQRLCREHGVVTRFGLSLLVDLAAIRAITRVRAEGVARRIQVLNPLHINDHVIARFSLALDQAIRR